MPSNTTKSPTKPKPRLKVNEANGIKAIKYLQGIADVPETTEQARAGWRGMSKHEKEFTIEFYNGHSELRLKELHDKVKQRK